MRKFLVAFLCLSFIATAPAFAAVNEAQKSLAARLLKELRKGNPDERAQAAWDLGQMEWEAAVPELTLALNDEVDYVRANAASALWRIGEKSASAEDELIAALDDPYGMVRVNAAGALLFLGLPEGDVLPAVYEVLDFEDDPRSAAYASNLLLDLKQPAKDVIVGFESALRDEDPGVRKEAMDLIHSGKNHPVELAPALLRAMKDSEEPIRWMATFNLGRTEGLFEEHLQAIARAYQDRSETVRQMAMNGLGRTKDHKYTPLVLGALKDRSADVRKEAAESLGNMGNASPDVVNGLLALLKERNSEVRQEAADALEALGADAKSAVPALKTALAAEKDVFVQHAIKRALSKMGEKVTW